MKELLIVLCALILIGVILVIRRSKKTDRLRANLKPGDVCRVYKTVSKNGTIIESDDWNIVTVRAVGYGMLVEKVLVHDELLNRNYWVLITDIYAL